MKHKIAFKPIVLSIALSILLITNSCIFLPVITTLSQVLIPIPTTRDYRTRGPSPQIVQSARDQIGKTLRYDPAYTKLTYPMGDVTDGKRRLHRRGHPSLT